ncbi:MAG: serine/threonine-protein kinase [Planctomycetales bacterium]
MQPSNADVKTQLGQEHGGGVKNPKPVIGEMLGKYQIRCQLGEGGMGAVYLGFDPLIEREVAIKILSPEVGNSSEILQRFLGEARAIGRLNHPNVVSIYEIDRWNEQYYLVMELLSGGSLAHRVNKSGPLPWEVACRMVSQAAAGLGAAHAAGMIHRDIKPENLMLNRDDQVKVVDFGLSKLVDHIQDTRTAVTRAGQILGTPQYMSPEQFEAVELDARTDIYSLGATLFRLLTARFPFQECASIVQVMTAHLTKPCPDPAQYAEKLPPECHRIVARAMAKRPQDRYQRAEDMAADLDKLIQSASQPVPVSSCEQPSRPLASALILEPSKLQGLMLRDALLKSNCERVECLTTCAETRREFDASPPDLLITSMQLSDGQGLELLRQLSGDKLTSRTTLVLNSSDSTIDDLLAAGTAPNVMLAPKKVRSEDILRLVHAGGPCTIESAPWLVPVKPEEIRIAVILDSPKLPQELADLIRDLQLFQVDVLSDAGAVSASDSPPALRLWLRTGGTSQDDTLVYSRIVSRADTRQELEAAVQVDAGRLFLRGIARQGVVSIVNRPLDRERMVCLLQACGL